MGGVYRQQSKFSLDRMAGLGGLGGGARVRDDHVSQIERLAWSLDERAIGSGRKGENICRGSSLSELPVYAVKLLVSSDDESKRCTRWRDFVAQGRDHSRVQAHLVNLADESRIYLDLHLESLLLSHDGYTPSPPSLWTAVPSRRKNTWPRHPHRLRLRTL